MSKPYYSILTNIGENLVAKATALGTKLELTTMAVGDGNGKLPAPDPAQTKLINEKRRAAVNSLEIDKNNPNIIIVEHIIPETEGGWWVREIGLFDSEGNLIAVGNCPETYKPQMIEGSGRTQIIRMMIVVKSTECIELKADPSVVLATRDYVDNEVLQIEAQQKDAENRQLKQNRILLNNNHILNNSQLELIAHRGFARQFPQNSLFGFSCAIEAGATSLECDVQASTDGVLYVFHDLDVSALTTGTGAFNKKSSAEIDQLRYKNVQGTPYADIRIPRFQDVLFLCKERGVKIYAEFSDHMTDANILEYIRLVTYYDAESNVSTQCFNNNKLLFVRQHNKNLELGFLRPTAVDYESLIPILQANAPAMFLMEMNSFLSDSTIAKKCRNANVGLAVWTVQNGTDLARVMRAGCNRVVSDVSLITKRRG